MDKFIELLFQNPVYFWGCLATALLIIMFLIFSGRDLKIGGIHVGSKRAGDISEKGQQIAPAAQRVKEALVSQPSTTLRKFNASYTLEVITLNLGRKATSQNDSQLSFILHAVETKSAKDLYKRNEKVDFALIELSGFGTVTGGPGTYEEKIDRYWLRRTSQDDMLECCAYSVCAWTRQSTTVWVDHIDPHNQEAAISVMRFEAV